MHPAVTLLAGAAVLAAVCALFWPNRGIVSLWRRLQADSERIRIEDALKHIYNNEYLQKKSTLESLCERLSLPRNQAAPLLEKMIASGMIEAKNGYYRLTDEGGAYALRIVRAHRLWERYLADETGLADREWHREAENREHSTSPEQIEELVSHLGNPLYDPHGAPIPGENGEVGPPMGRPLIQFAAGEIVVVNHIKDEPEELFSQIAAEGIFPGMRMRMLEVSPQRLRLSSHQDEHVLAPVVAAQISAIPLPVEAQVDEEETLAALDVGETGQVVRFSPHCRGIERRRLMDLGVLPGTLIAAELTSPFGDPKAYRVRGAVIALRDELANMIYIEKLKGAA
ncbi:MAG: iron dependent repressor, metal binding and dimerization domain protein [Candidatus Omnitrophota bacterium]